MIGTFPLDRELAPRSAGLVLTTVVDPDLSNPTRPRFERPLDTIRSFEAAIYGQYSGRPGSYAQTGEYSYLRSAVWSLIRCSRRIYSW